MIAWTEDPAAQARFLSRVFAEVPLPLKLDRAADGAARALCYLEAPDGLPTLVVVRLVGDTVRLTAHRTVEGALNPTVLRNYNEVAQAPWFGRVFPSSEDRDTDLSLGAPAPAHVEDPYPLLPLLQVLLGSAAEVRAVRVPTYRGFPDPAPRSVLAQVRGRLAARGAVEEAHGGRVLVGLRGDGVGFRLEAFLVPPAVLVARAIPAVPPCDADEGLLRRLAQFNRGLAAGASAWWPEARQVYGCASLFPALTPVDDRTVDWLEARALDAARGAVWAAGGDEVG